LIALPEPVATIEIQVMPIHNADIAGQFALMDGMRFA